MRLAIDASVWLYQAAARLPPDSDDPSWAAAAEELALRARKLVEQGVSVVVVFDCPRAPPSKEQLRERRRAKRMAAAARNERGLDYRVARGLAEGADDELEGDSGDERPAAAHPQAAMADEHGNLQSMFIAALTRHHIAWIMSPGEADHQIASLYEQGLVNAAVTVDSDLLVLAGCAVLHGLRARWLCEVRRRAVLAARASAGRRGR